MIGWYYISNTTCKYSNKFIHTEECSIVSYQYRGTLNAYTVYQSHTLTNENNAFLKICIGTIGWKITSACSQLFCCI